MNYRSILDEKNLRPSIIRMKVLEYLDRNRVHPTVDEIYEGLSDDIPTLSKTSVYNTVKLLRDSGIIHELTIEESRAHYDFCTAFHGHLLCDCCKRVVDVPVESLENPNLNGHNVRSTQVYYLGICKDCLSVNKN